MTIYASTLLTLLSDRGYIHQATDAAALDALAAREIVTGYIGFDATAPSLHVGSLVQIMMLRRLQQAGHRPIVLMGGGTTKVGDPSGKDESRQMLSDEKIRKNIQGIRRVFKRFLTFDYSETSPLFINNSRWLDRLRYIPFLREVGPHFTLNRMLTFDSVKLRLEREQPLTFLEFNYMILQAYDFLELSRKAECRLQMGGSDQWGNIVNGIELARRIDRTELFGITTPLITTADGAKMGKTAKGAVWLNKELTSAYEYWQFWRNTADADVAKFLKLFTDLPLELIDQLGKLAGAEINEAKKILATQATALLHGKKAALKAAFTAHQTFERRRAGDDLPTYKAEGQSISIVDALVQVGFCSSRGEARRKISENAVRVNEMLIEDPGEIIPLGKHGFKISLGKKKYGLIVPA